MRGERRWWLFAAAMFALTAACGGGAGIGGSCEETSDCRSDLQCLAGACVPRCEVDRECGDGFTCEDGLCEAVVSALGDMCMRERDCGPGQTCTLDLVDGDEDGRLAGTCQAESPGSATGADCKVDRDCHFGTCSLGQCTQMCLADSDCPDNLVCADMPRLLPNSAPLFSGCLEESGTLALDIPVSLPHQEIRVPVPSTALSIALVARIDDETQLVGAARIEDPDGALLYATPFSQDEFYENPIRHLPAPSISTVMIPNTPVVALKTGVYEIEVGSFFAAGGNGTAIPSVTVIYKLAPAVTLDLNLHFLNLVDHPCGASAILDATTAQTDTGFQGYVAELSRIFGTAGIVIGDITYTDVDRPDLDGLRSIDLPRLLKLSASASGINVFFTRSIIPVGIQALAGGTPGPPNMPGTEASGIAVSMDTLCYRDWLTIARATAHEIGGYLGLFRNREPDGATDPIPDSDDSSDNLMYYSETGGTALSPGQISVLRLNPGLR